MQTIQNIVPEKKWNIKCPYKMNPTRIVVHNTANDASARNEISYMIGNDNQVSFHYAIDDKEIVQGVWEDRGTWNAGDGKTGKGNREGIAIEICYSKSGGDRFAKAEDLAAQFIAYKLKVYGWGIDRVTKHQDYSGKYCPHRTLDLGWERFLDMVKKYLNDVPSVVAPVPTDNTINELTSQISALNSQIEAYKGNVSALQVELDKYKHIESEQTKTINELNALLKARINEVESLQSEIVALNDKLHLCDLQVGNMPRPIFTCSRTGFYKIHLDKDNVLYIKE